MSEWIEHRTNDMPVPGITIVQAITSKGRVLEEVKADEVAWDSAETSDPIVAYRIAVSEDKHFPRREEDWREE